MAEADKELCTLLLAALYKVNPGFVINYKAMEELSTFVDLGGAKTHVALEHKVRPLRKRAQEIANGAGGTGGAVSAPVTPKKRGKGKANGGEDDAEEGQVKKVKKTPAKPRGKKAQAAADQAAGSNGAEVATAGGAEMSFEFEDSKGGVMKDEDGNSGEEVA